MRYLIVICLAALAGCASSNYMPNAGKERTPLPEGCPVQMLSTAPKGEFVELGVCSAKASGGGAFMDFSEKALVELRRCACQAGGNAVLVMSQGDTGFLGSQQRVRATGSVLWIPPE